jgi:hypothetical protein
MALSPLYVGQLLPVFPLILADDSGAVVDLTGATMTANWYTAGSARAAAAGAVVIVSAAAGTVTYTLGAADTATVRTCIFQIVATYPGAKPLIWDYSPIIVLP